MTGGVSGVWIRASDGQLVAADSVTRLRCDDGQVMAMSLDGSWLRLAGPGCPPGFHVQLLDCIARTRRLLDDRWVVIVAGGGAGADGGWVSATTEDLDDPPPGAAPVRQAITG